MKLKQGDLVLVPFPFSDLSAIKTRPALIVSNASLKGEDCLLVAVTSQSSGGRQIDLDTKDLINGELPVKSYIRPAKLVSLKKSIVRRTMGTVSQKKLKEVQTALFELLK